MNILNKLTKLDTQITPKEAVLFYIFYLVLYQIVGVLLSLIIITLGLQDSASQIGSVLSVMLTFGLGWLVYKSRKKSRSLNITMILTIVFTLVLGSFAGLIPVAWMMTQNEISEF